MELDNSKTQPTQQFNFCAFISDTKPQAEFNIEVVLTFRFKIMAFFKGFLQKPILIRKCTLSQNLLLKLCTLYQTLTAVTSLAELEAELHRRLVYIQLLQWQVHGCRCVLLAAFCSPLSELLYPQQGSRGLISGVDVDLLMEATSCFPVSSIANRSLNNQVAIP